MILLRLRSEDGANRLTRACVLALTDAVHHLTASQRPLVITGGHRFFSAGADLAEIAALTGPDAYRFSQMGQALMNAIEQFPAPVYAAIEGYCMGGGLDLALACHGRVASPAAVFGHRGAVLGLITGWGGTQRLPRLVGMGLPCASDLSMRSPATRSRKQSNGSQPDISHRLLEIPPRRRDSRVQT